MQSAAVDTAFLLALAAGDPVAEGACDFFTKRRTPLTITETVYEQLGDLRHFSTDQEVKRLAVLATQQLTNWLIIQVGGSQGGYTTNGTSETVAQKLLDAGLIPDASKTEANILVEAACMGCDFLVTYSPSLLAATAGPIGVFLRDYGWRAPIIVSPRSLS